MSAEIITCIDDDFEIMDFADIRKQFSIKITNYANYIVWRDSISYNKYCPLNQNYTFGNQSTQIKLPYNYEQNYAQLIVQDENIYLENINANISIIYDQNEKIDVEKLSKVEKYNVKYYPETCTIEFKYGDEVFAFQINQRIQNLQSGKKYFGYIQLTQDGRLLYANCYAKSECKLKIGERILIKNCQKMRINSAEISIKYDF